DGQWHHLVGVRDVAIGTVSLYLDGALVASAADTTTGTFTLPGAADRIASRPPNPTPMFFNGLIDEVEVYRRALLPGEIQSIFNAGAAGKCKTTPTLTGTGPLNFTLSNPGAITLSGVSFTDALPAGLVVATPNGLTGSCSTGSTVALTAT